MEEEEKRYILADQNEDGVSDIVFHVLRLCLTQKQLSLNLDLNR